jgi:hypothetical protein
VTVNPKDRELASLLLAGLKAQGSIYVQDGDAPLEDLLLDGWVSLTLLAQYVREHTRKL